VSRPGLAVVRPRRRVSVLVADPPWKYGDKLPGRGRGAAKQYKCLPLECLERFSLPELGDNAILFLWRVAQMQDEALQLCRAWGFEPYGEMVWNKLTKHGKQHFGMGRVMRYSHESILVGMRGRALPSRRNIRSSFSAPTPTAENGRVIHSAKPDEFFRLVELMYPRAARFEMFARRVRPGWVQFGNQLGKLGRAA